MSQRSTLCTTTASEFLNVLNTLGCPYTQDVNESYVNELLFTPGEHRIRLLLWIFGEVHGSVEKMVNSQDIIMRQNTDFGVDKRVQVLTSLSASFGICRAADLDLIRGKTTHTKQLCFWKKLFSIVQFSKMVCLDDAHVADKCIIEEMVTLDQNLVLNSASEKLDVLPHNLRKEMAMMLPNQKHALNGFGNIQENLEKLGESLEIHQKKLAEIENCFEYTSKDDKIAFNNVSCKLSLTLNDLDQMMTTFEQVFTNSYLPYCNKQTEEFGGLGQLVQIVNKQLGFVVKTLNNLSSVRLSSNSISRCTDSWPKIKEKVLRFACTFEEFLSESVNGLDQLSRTIDTKCCDAPHITDIPFSSGHSVLGTKMNETISDICVVK